MGTLRSPNFEPHRRERRNWGDKTCRKHEKCSRVPVMGTCVTCQTRVAWPTSSHPREPACDGGGHGDRQSLRGPVQGAPRVLHERRSPKRSRSTLRVLPYSTGGSSSPGALCEAFGRWSRGTCSLPKRQMACRCTKRWLLLSTCLWCANFFSPDETVRFRTNRCHYITTQRTQWVNVLDRQLWCTVRVFFFEKKLATRLNGCLSCPSDDMLTEPAKLMTERCRVPLLAQVQMTVEFRQQRFCCFSPSVSPPPPPTHTNHRHHSHTHHHPPTHPRTHPRTHPHTHPPTTPLHPRTHARTHTQSWRDLFHSTLPHFCRRERCPRFCHATEPLESFIISSIIINNITPLLQASCWLP